MSDKFRKSLILIVSICFMGCTMPKLFEVVIHQGNLVDSEMIEKLRSYGVDSCTSSLELLSALSNYPGSAVMPNALKIHTQAVFIPCFARLSVRQRQKIYKAIDRIKDILL